MKTIRNVFRLSCLLIAAMLTLDAAADEPVLKLASNGEQLDYTRTQLLKHPETTDVSIVGDVAYHGKMHYRAIPIATLLAHFHPEADDVIQFVATDGFVAELPIAPLLNRDTNSAVAYLAVEPVEQPWPELKPGGKQSAGPFYLVWLHPDRAHIGREQWPYQVAKIEVRVSLRKRWPALAPSTTVPTNSAINRGFSVFQKNCFACHTLNRSGDATKGPDLNVPMNPTEYFQRDALRKLIRNPQSVRTWSNSVMPGFDDKVLSNRDLDNLLAYLKHMARRKTAAP
ncbi:MAG: cytochrome c [Gammaproteobacteria bacterium]|nr:cytochrome c [Gammaproteobacteria bacterium]